MTSNPQEDPSNPLAGEASPAEDRENLNKEEESIISNETHGGQGILKIKVLKTNVFNRNFLNQTFDLDHQTFIVASVHKI